MPQDDHHWGYSRPEEWTKHYPVGQHQSPINILVSNYDQLIQSTCCAANGNSNNNSTTNNNNHKHHHHHGHVITERMASLYLANGSKSSLGPPRVVELQQPKQQQQPRTHLDSVGDDLQHPRSSSTCSSASAFSAASGSCPPSPAGHNYDSDSDSQYATNNNELLSASGHHMKEAQRTRYCISNHKIFLGYPRYLNSIQLCNTGHSWQVNLPPEIAHHTLVSGPPFGDREYRLAQLHCHWGEDIEHGSEHLINGCSFAAEIHFVHWNCTDYSSMQEASKHKHGLAVLGVMVQALDGEHNRNKHLDKIANALRQVERPGSRAEVHARLDLKKLFPANRWNYATYEGSLTTPPLSEVVDWCVFLEPIQCSTAQLEQFRQLRCPLESELEGEVCDQQMIKNHRPVQPHNGRLVSIWAHH